MTAVEFPDMRLNVEVALEELADTGGQTEDWFFGGRVDPGGGGASLSNVLHWLYDDFAELADPQARVPHVLFPDEVPSLVALDAILGPLAAGSPAYDMRELAQHPLWPDVVARAQYALELMRANDAA